MISPTAAPAVRTNTGARSAARPIERPNGQIAIPNSASVTSADTTSGRHDTPPGYRSPRAAPLRQALIATNYRSGDDYVVEFLGHRFCFSACDFEERVTAAAVRLGLLDSSDLDADERADLVELAADGRIDEARSELGRYLVRHWERIALVGDESLVYWLRKLVFRGAWLDHRVKEGLLEVAWDDDIAEFAYRDPRGGRALLELAPVPSWHELGYRT
jgi:hypothetical protein